MVILIVLALVVVVAVGATWLMRRRGGDEVHSVEGYQHTLSTLQGMRAKSSMGAVRVLGRPQAPSDEGRVPEGPHERVPGSSPSGSGPIQVGGLPGGPPGGPGGLVFEDPAVAGAVDAREARSSQRTRDRAMTAMNHRSHRLGAPIVAVAAVVVIAVVLALVGANSPHHRAGTAATSTTVPVTGRPAGGTPSTTATTTPVPASFGPLDATATSATYAIPGAPYSVTVAVAGGECWVQLQTASGNTVLFAKTVAAGQQETFPMVTPATLNLGAPSSATVTVDGRPVGLPSGFQSPFTLTFHTPSTGAGSGGAG